MTLDQRREQAIQLREEGLTYKEIGERLGVPKHTAKRDCNLDAFRARDAAKKRRKYKRDPESNKLKSKQWRINNPEKATALRQKHRAENPDKHRAYNQKWRRLNPEKVKENAKKYRESSKHEELVYFIEAGNLIKIGRTTNVTYRIPSMQTDSSVPLRLIAICDHPESQIHEQFAHLRDHGEWFRRSPEIDHFLDEHAMRIAA